MLPRFIKYNLDGYRGYEVVKFPLKIFQRKDGQWVVWYAHDGAEWAIVVFNDFDKEKAIADMEEYIKKHKVNERKVFQIGDLP